MAPQRSVGILALQRGEDVKASCEGEGGHRADAGQVHVIVRTGKFHHEVALDDGTHLRRGSRVEHPWLSVRRCRRAVSTVSRLPALPHRSGA
jgi:hypothetical protein